MQALQSKSLYVKYISHASNKYVLSLRKFSYLCVPSNLNNSYKYLSHMLMLNKYILKSELIEKLKRKIIIYSNKTAIYNVSVMQDRL